MESYDPSAFRLWGKVTACSVDIGSLPKVGMVEEILGKSYFCVGRIPDILGGYLQESADSRELSGKPKMQLRRG
jgi:hypothetical protein